MSNENNIPEPSIPNWVKILNQYNTDYYQGGKLIKAEEWNALFAADVAQGNYHANTLDLLINTYLPEKFEEISEDMAELNTSVNSDITEFKNIVNTTISNFEDSVETDIIAFKFEVNSDIAEIEEAVQQANTNANTAVSNSTSAIQTANTAISKSDSAVSIANAASTTANSAKTIAEAISSIAEDAKDIAEATQDSLTNYYTKTETDTLFSNLINGAPEEFDTLKEISDWIANDESGTAALINRVSTLETDMTTAETNISSLQTNKVDNSTLENYYTKDELSGKIIPVESASNWNTSGNLLTISGGSNLEQIRLTTPTSGWYTTIGSNSMQFRNANPATFGQIDINNGPSQASYVSVQPSSEQLTEGVTRGILRPFGLFFTGIGNRNVAGFTSVQSTNELIYQSNNTTTNEQIIKYSLNDVQTQITGNDLVTALTGTNTLNVNKVYTCTENDTSNTYLAGHLYKISGSSGAYIATDITPTVDTNNVAKLNEEQIFTQTQYFAGRGDNLGFDALKVTNNVGQERIGMGYGGLRFYGANISQNTGSIGNSKGNNGDNLYYTDLRNNGTAQFVFSDLPIKVTGDTLVEYLSTSSSEGKIYSGQVVICTENDTNNTYTAGHIYKIGGTSGSYTATDITVIGEGGGGGETYPTLDDIQSIGVLTTTSTVGVASGQYVGIAGNSTISYGNEGSEKELSTTLILPIVEGDNVTLTPNETNTAVKINANVSVPDITVDSELSTTSENPVQNSIITNALNNKQNVLTPGKGITISENNVISTTGGETVDPKLNTLADAITNIATSGDNTGMTLEFENTFESSGANEYFTGISSGSSVSKNVVNIENITTTIGSGINAIEYAVPIINSVLSAGYDMLTTLTLSVNNATAYARSISERGLKITPTDIKIYNTSGFSGISQTIPSDPPTTTTTDYSLFDFVPDASLSTTSTHAIQNSVVTTALNQKANSSQLANYQTKLQSSNTAIIEDGEIRVKFRVSEPTSIGINAALVSALVVIESPIGGGYKSKILKVEITESYTVEFSDSISIDLKGTYTFVGPTNNIYSLIGANGLIIDLETNGTITVRRTYSDLSKTITLSDTAPLTVQIYSLYYE